MKYLLANGNTVIATPDFIAKYYPDATLIADPETTPDTKITRLQFRQRFTLAEKAAIELAALDNPGAAIEQRQLAAMLRAVLADQAAAEFIDLADESTIEGVQLLVQAGLLTESRGVEILAP